MPGRIRDPGPSGKDKALYERLRAEDAGAEQSARIANAAADPSRSEVTRTGGGAGPYDGWTVGRLRERAAEIGIAGRSSMRRAELIEALRAR